MMKAAPSTSTAGAVPPLRFREALEKAKPAMAALTQAELIEVNLDIPSAVTAVTAYAESKAFTSLRPRIKALPELDLTHYDMLVTYALAAGQAHLDLCATSGSLDYKENVVRLEQARGLLKSDIEALARRKLLDGSRLRELRNPNGHQNLAFDVLICCNILRAHWSTIEGRTATSLEELTRFEQLVERVTFAVALRNQKSAAVKRAADARTRAFTLLVNAHDQVRRAIAYLRWQEGDADSILPSLYYNRGGRRRTRQKEVHVTTALEGSATHATELGNGASTNGATAPPANGMPDEAPFTNDEGATRCSSGYAEYRSGSARS